LGIFVFSSLVTNMGQLELEEEMLESQLEELQVFVKKFLSIFSNKSLFLVVRVIFLRNFCSYMC
jgi:hypothetical protein